MPRVNYVKSARKEIKQGETVIVAVGEPYYWWKFRFGGKRISKTYPKRSQLTQSSFLSQLYDIQDNLESLTAEDASSLESEVQGICSELENLKNECQNSLDNMPKQLQYAPTGELLQSRIDALDDAISELESIDFSDEPELDEDATDEEKETFESECQDWLDEKVNEVQSVSIDCE